MSGLASLTKEQYGIVYYIRGFHNAGNRSVPLRLIRTDLYESRENYVSGFTLYPDARTAGDDAIAGLVANGMVRRTLFRDGVYLTKYGLQQLKWNDYESEQQTHTLQAHKHDL